MRKLVCILLTLIAFSACRREITYDYHPYCDVAVDVDWSSFSETPTGMTAMFYPHDGGEPIVYTTHSIHKATFALRTGTYNMILFNQSPSEFGSIGFRGMDRYETAAVYALENQSKSWYSKADVEKVAFEPEPFAVATIENLEVTEDMLDRQRAGLDTGLNSSDTPESKVATKADYMIEPKTLTVWGRITIHVDGIYNLRSVRGSISGMSEGVTMHNSRTSDSEVTHLLESWQSLADEDDPSRGIIQTEYSTFCMPGMTLSRASEVWDNAFLNLSILLVDRVTVKDYTFFVGDLIRLSDGTDRIVLRIDLQRTAEDGEAPVVLPDVKPSGGSSSGFDATVDSWGDEVGVDVPVN